MICKFCHNNYDLDLCPNCGNEIASLSECNLFMNKKAVGMVDVHITNRFLFVRKYSKSEAFRTNMVRGLGSVVSTVSMLTSLNKLYNYDRYDLRDINYVVYPYKKGLNNYKRNCKIVFHNGCSFELCYGVIAKYMKELVNAFTTCNINVIDEKSAKSISSNSYQSINVNERDNFGFCDKCGNKLKPNANFCDKCGNKIV